MAVTERGELLTRSHFVEQQAVKGQATRDALILWELLDFDRLDDTTERWLAATERLVVSESLRSTQIAQSYFQQFAEAETGRFYPPPPGRTVDRDVVRRDLMVTGPLRYLGLRDRGYAHTRAFRTAQTENAGEVARLTMWPHRQTLVDSPSGSYGSEPAPAGWQRVVRSAKPCAFCLLMASRGPVYETKSTANFRAHANCNCTVELVFRRDAPWRPENLEARQLYNRSIREAAAAGELRRGTDNDLLNAFRRAVAAERRV